MRNLYHYIVGFTFAYIIFIVLGINTVNFPISLEYWNNAFTPLLGAIFVAIPAFFWERNQEIRFNAVFDINDIYRSAVGGLLGGFIAMIYSSWYIVIPMAVISSYLLIFKRNK